MDPAPEPFGVSGPAGTLAGEELGEGEPIVLLHGLTATRRYVLHGSKLLPRRGWRLISYDARGHGRSDAPAAGHGFDYGELAADLVAVIADRAEAAPVVLVGHSMGAQTAVRMALEHPDLVRALVLIGPAWTGAPIGEEALANWDALADALEQGGVEAFVDVNVEQVRSPEWRDVVRRISSERLSLHLHPDAVARALREVPRSDPFGPLSRLDEIGAPALVVASHDDADPGHPYDVAAEWAEHLPRGTLVSEEPGESPLAWQGGRLSRTIADYLEETL